MLNRKYNFLLILVILVSVFVSSAFTLLDTPEPSPEVPSDDGEEVDESMFTWGVRPETLQQGYFTFILEPGETVEDAVLVLNGRKNSDEPLNVMISTYEAVTGQTGGITFGYDEGEITDWIDLPGEGVVSVPTGSAVRLPFSVTVPEGTPPGEYVAGIVSMLEEDLNGGGGQQIEGESENGGFALTVVPRVISTVLVIVPEPTLCRVEIDSVEHEFKVTQGFLSVKVNMRHSGDLHYVGEGTFTLIPENSEEEPIVKDFPVGYFIPGDSIAYPLNFFEIPDAGKYSYELELRGDCEFVYHHSENIISLNKKDVEEAKDNSPSIIYEKPDDIFDLNSVLLTGVMCLLGLLLLALLIFGLSYLIKRAKKEDSEKTDSSEPRED